MQRKEKVHLLKRAKIKIKMEISTVGVAWRFASVSELSEHATAGKRKGNIEREMNNALLLDASARNEKK